MTRPKPTKRPQTVSTSLTDAQYGWLVSQGPNVAHTLRVLVQREVQWAADQAERAKGVPVGPLAVLA